jgi:hypothetical protein
LSTFFWVSVVLLALGVGVIGWILDSLFNMLEPKKPAPPPIERDTLDMT